MSPKFLNRFGDKKRRSDVEAASFRQWEEPLYVVVHGFQQLIGPSLNVVQITTTVIWFRATVKPDDQGVRHERYAAP